MKSAMPESTFQAWLLPTRICMKYILLLCLLISLPGPLQATNAEREQRWIDQTVDSIFDGEAVFLEAEGHRFLSIYTESETASSKGMIVLHGTGFHPDWEQVVQPVRVRMTARGWNTLSIQLPLLEKSAAYEDYVPLYPEVPPRMRAATEYLMEQGVDTIVVVAHSQGATMASYYLARTEHEVKAFVAIGMSSQYTQAKINSTASLKLINIPVLDIYGSRDFPTVLRTTETRQEASQHNKGYKQIVIDEAYHFFDNTDHEHQLLDTMSQWLDEQL
ncbi:MAG: pimeloyl-ACP methyl ester carboxylesterase [Granulosicoccus sp.]|jgi:pimeloyl-ACP methyl ester carboxylesterase